MSKTKEVTGRKVGSLQVGDKADSLPLAFPAAAPHPPCVAMHSVLQGSRESGCWGCHLLASCAVWYVMMMETNGIF